MDSYDVIANQPVVIDNVSSYLRLVVGLFASSTRYLQCPTISNVPKNHGRSHIESVADSCHQQKYVSCLD